MIKNWESDRKLAVSASELTFIHRLLNCGVDSAVVAEAFGAYQNAVVGSGFHDKQGQAGEGHHNAKVSERDVEFIRQLRERGVSEEVLAVVCGLSKRTIGAICRFERWQS